MTEYDGAIITTPANSLLIVCLDGFRRIWRLALMLASEFSFMHNLEIDLAVDYRLKDKVPHESLT